MDHELNLKYDHLREILTEIGETAVAFSGGVDSALLLHVAGTVCRRVFAVTAVSELFPSKEQEEAAAFCRERGIRQYPVRPDVMAVPGFPENPPDRCYLCKKALFTQMLAAAASEGYSVLCEGSNKDDLADYRPGKKALKELGIRSPLLEAGFTKRDIRALAASLGLAVSEKPSYACLASRIPYGERITPEKLSMAERAEQFLRDSGFGQLRVRVHGTLARIEVEPHLISRFADSGFREAAAERFREIGFSYTAVDLTGYRTGSLNEVLPEALTGGKS